MTTLANRRCPVCTWTGMDDDVCPDCGHGTVEWTLRMED